MRVTPWVSYVEIDGISEDKEKVRGLCGNFNGDRSDDFMDPNGVVTTSCPARLCPAYTSTWRVPQDKDLFDCKFTDYGTFDYPIPSMCTCETHLGQDVQCGEPYVKNTGLSPRKSETVSAPQRKLKPNVT